MEELGAEPALAHSRLTHHGHQLTGTLLRSPFEGADQQRLLQLPAHERRRLRAGDVRAETGAGLQRTEEGEGLRLALHHHRLQLLVVEHALRGPIRLPGDGDSVDRRRLLQARGCVDHVAGHDPLALLRAGTQHHDRLPRVDPDPNQQ